MSETKDKAHRLTNDELAAKLQTVHEFLIEIDALNMAAIVWCAKLRLQAFPAALRAAGIDPEEKT